MDGRKILEDSGLWKNGGLVGERRIWEDSKLLRNGGLVDKRMILEDGRLVDNGGLLDDGGLADEDFPCFGLFSCCICLLGVSCEVRE